MGWLYSIYIPRVKTHEGLVIIPVGSLNAVLTYHSMIYGLLQSDYDPLQLPNKERTQSRAQRSEQHFSEGGKSFKQVYSCQRMLLKRRFSPDFSLLSFC